MTLDEYRKQQNWPWHRVARELTLILAATGDAPVYENRLNRLRRGAKPTAAEVRALYDLCPDADGYKDAEA